MSANVAGRRQLVRGQCPLLKRHRQPARGSIVSRSLIKSLAKYVLGLALLAYVIVHNWQSTENGPGLAEAVSRSCVVCSGYTTSAILGELYKPVPVREDPK